MSIDEEDGRMIFSASREKVAFMVFGAFICIETFLSALKGQPDSRWLTIVNGE